MDKHNVVVKKPKQEHSFLIDSPLIFQRSGENVRSIKSNESIKSVVVDQGQNV
jgi:hypothetical protein